MANLTEFDGDILNIVPVDRDDSGITITWHPDAEILLRSHMPKSKDIKLYSDMGKNKLLKSEYFDQYQTIKSNAIIDNGIICAEILNTALSNLEIKIVSDKYNMGNRLKSILYTSTVYALPIIAEERLFIGGANTVSSPNIMRSIDHIVLCLGKVNNKYLII